MTASVRPLDRRHAEGRHVLYEQAGLSVEADYRPLARGDGALAWGSETHVAPWVIYVLRAGARSKATVTGE